MNNRQRQVCFEVMRRVLQRGQNVLPYLQQAIKFLSDQERCAVARLILDNRQQSNADLLAENEQLKAEVEQLQAALEELQPADDEEPVGGGNQPDQPAKTRKKAATTASA